MVEGGAERGGPGAWRSDVCRGTRPLHLAQCAPLLPWFRLRVTRIERPYLIEGRASGELAGVGTWRLYEGHGTAIVYDWRVRTTKWWMNLFGPLARPAFSWNHDVVMRQGGKGLAEELGATLLVQD